MFIPFILLPFVLISQILYYYSFVSPDKNFLSIFKPLTTLIIILIAGYSLLYIGIGKNYALLIFVGLLFSLIGDISLIFAIDKQKRLGKFFIIGLSSFLITHIIYVTAFSIFDGFFIQDIIVGSVLLIVVIVLFLIYNKKGEISDKIKIPTLIYMLVLAFMLTKALSTIQSIYFSDTQKLLIIIGAVMFVASDILLGIRYFIKSRNSLRIALLLLYFNGQYLIALSCYY